ncbi:hypothetical protein [Pseudorhodoferax sp.]|uniref:hypothetical protein n=1 Tax=Pseudorhodoferax sp. TaxID=1993553 RepID=UPI002DD6370D|nr:hypothetical protein [Pseudorhodoferax sp.]
MKAALWCACMLLAGAAHGQTAAADAAPACPAPQDMRALHLYGGWRAQWQGSEAPAAVLQLQRHPELSDSVRGRVERDGITALLAGDVDDGDLTLEESRDGKRISATWIGRVVPDSCGKEIRGTWTDADAGTKRDFVLRRQSGW